MSSMPIMRKRNSEMIDWLNEYSDVNQEKSSTSSLQNAKNSRRSSILASSVSSDSKEGA